MEPGHYMDPKLESHIYFDEENDLDNVANLGSIIRHSARLPLQLQLGRPWPQQVGIASTEADALNGTTTLFSNRTCGKAGVSTCRS